MRRSMTRTMQPATKITAEGGQRQPQHAVPGHPLAHHRGHQGRAEELADVGPG